MTGMLNKTKKRLIVTFLVVGILLVALTFRLGWVMIVNGETYSKMAVQQQTKDVPIEAKRGKILDRNGKELAISAATFSIWARPANVRYIKNGTDEQMDAKVYATASKLAEVLDMDIEEIKELITQNKSLVKVAKYVDKENADLIRSMKLSGIEIAEDVKRYYPNGAFAAQLLGSVTDDNNGLAGIELRYNKYLKGVPGRWVKNTDIDGNQLSYGVEKYYAAEDGLTAVLTLDEVIQHYAQKAIETVQINTEADRVMCIVMDPKTGDILAMAMTPTYDPNNPRTPMDEEEAAAYAQMTSEEQLDYLNQMWRNPMVSDVYEPGSTSKLMTTAIALEEGLTSLNENFVCTGYFTVGGKTTLKCWRYYRPHGTETLVQAVQNSCNPVFATLAARIGIEKFYDYMELFGMTEKTGIDYPGEAMSIMQDINTAGPVGLATMSYGQGIAVTMIQQLTAVCSLGNDGKLMQPRIVKALEDSDGNVVKTFDTKVVRQVISEQTASDMCMIMESVVSEGGGGNAKVVGYRVGGKTGTANKPSPTGGYSNETYSSFIGMAPMDDPQVALLVVVDNPKGVKYGSTTAAPGAQQILSDTLRYLNVEPKYTQAELDQINSKRSIIPEVTGINVSDAIGRLAGVQLNYIISPEYDGEEDFIVVDQYPKAGEKLDIGGTVYLYRE